MYFVVPEEKSSLVDIDPKQFCGFNPCDISKCLLAPLGSCVSDYKCRPVFFDENNKRIEGCVGKNTAYFVRNVIYRRLSEVSATRK